MNKVQIFGYRFMKKPGEFTFILADQYEMFLGKQDHDIWALYTEPQEGCSQEVAVYRGAYWVQPKYLLDGPPEGFFPLYAGPHFHLDTLKHNSQELSNPDLYPGIVEARLQASFPELYRKESDVRKS